MIILLIVGVILLIVGYMAPTPPPIHTLLIIGGWIMVAIAGILLIVGLLNGTFAFESPAID